MSSRSSEKRHLDIQTALLQGTKLLEEGEISAPRLTAEVLLAHATGHDRSWLYAYSDRELKEVEWIHYGRYLHQRLQGVPTQYITKRQEFWGRDFLVGPDVLIPRPETEHVIEAALEKWKEGRAVDVGTGSGAIAITLALETGRPVAASDISTGALSMSSENARRLSAATSFVQCDLLSAFRDHSAALIVSNPPYVPETDRPVLQREVRDHEPHLALFGGPDGLGIYRRLIDEAPRVLIPGGWLILELAYNAGDSVRQMLTPAWTGVEVRADLAGLPRVILARLP